MHANNIRAWCGAVDKRYKDFASRMDKYGTKLKETLGVHQEEEVREVDSNKNEKLRSFKRKEKH